MKAKKIWWATAAVVTAVAVGGTAAVGVAVQQARADLTHGPAYVAERAEPLLTPAQPGPAPDRAALAGRLDDLARDTALGTFGGQVIDTTTGDVVWSKDADSRMVPASSTKVLTAAAAVLAAGEQDRLTTEVVRGEQEDSVVIKAAGDVWLGLGQLDELAEQIKKAGGATAVFIDTSAWTGPEQAPAWDPENVDAGYVAPMQPAMVYGARLGAATGDVPRSHTPALDVANLVAKRLGAQTVGVSPAPAGAEVIASVESDTLAERAQQMMKYSDNVAAEAIGREVALARGAEPSFAGATQATLEILAEAGFNTEGVTIADNSGLSTENRIPPALLASIVARASTEESLRAVLGYLPVAGGEGTLYTRYSEQAGKGFVRAKTGTLTGVSALVGTALGQSGRVYAFSFLVNDGEDILSARVAQDSLASALTEF